MPFANWDATRSELVHALATLADGEFLVLSEPAPGGDADPPEPSQTRYVQVLRVHDVLTAECVGATSLGGTWEMNPETIARLLALGWLTPEESLRQYGHRTPNFVLCVERASLTNLADVLVTSLLALDALPPVLELQTSD